jgi:Holliday junction DNA helicase RuvB
MEYINSITLVTEISDDPFVSEFDGFIGQKSAVKQIEFFIKSHSDETPFPTLLLSGSHGLGKTYLAEKTAGMMNRRFVSINCGEMKKSSEFIEKVLMPISYYSVPTTIFMDESHNLSNDITTLLLTLLNPSSSKENRISYLNGEVVYDMRNINMVFATTDAHHMFGPLKNRCTSIYFYPYENSEIIDILKFYLGGITLKCNLSKLADACRSRARDAYVLTQNIKRYCSLNSLNYLDNKHWDELKDIFDIRPCGLRREEVNLLKVIANHGPISCANIALKLMVNEDNVKSELEIRLRELGFIASTTKGRVLTNEGKGYIDVYVD